MHSRPFALQRSQVYVKLVGAAPDQVPGTTVSAWPAAAVPLSVGWAVAASVEAFAATRPAREA